MKKLTTILTIILLSGKLYAQDQNDTLTIDDLYIDFTAPEITAFSILDLEVEEVVTPGSTKEFLASILNYVDDDGNAKPGLALEWAPAHSFIKSVPETGLGRSIRNLSISLATASSDTTSSQLGLGVKWTIYDGTNPYNNKGFRENLDNFFKDLDTKFGEIHKTARPEIIIQKNVMIGLLEDLSVEDADEVVDNVFRLSSQDGFSEIRSHFIDNEILQVSHTVHEFFLGQMLDEINSSLHDTIKSDARILSSINKLTESYLYLNAFASPEILYKKELEKLKNEFQKSNWNKLAVQLSGGWGWHSDSSFIGEYKQMVGTFAFTAGFPIGHKDVNGPIFSWLRENARLLLQAKYQNYDNERFELNDQWSIGSRFVFGRSKVRVSYEFAYLDEENESVEPSIDESGWRHTLGVQYKISEDFWTEVAFAGRTSATTSGLEMLPRFTFRRNFRTNPRE